ncbi:MAG: hypothetical protein ACOC3V_05140 [bacterium]
MVDNCKCDLCHKSLNKIMVKNLPGTSMNVCKHCWVLTYPRLKSYIEVNKYLDKIRLEIRRNKIIKILNNV